MGQILIDLAFCIGMLYIMWQLKVIVKILRNLFDDDGTEKIK